MKHTLIKSISVISLWKIDTSGVMSINIKPFETEISQLSAL